MYKAILHNATQKCGAIVKLALKLKAKPFTDNNTDYNVCGSYATVVLIEHDAFIEGAETILEYLEERYPAPPMYPTHPVARANTKMCVRRIMSHLYDPTSAMHHDLIEELETILQQKVKFFLGDTISVIDLALAPYAEQSTKPQWRWFYERLTDAVYKHSTVTN